MRFKDRDEAGKLLADKLSSYGHFDPIVLALPRGGVPIAAIIAEKLKASLDVVLVKKIQAPGSEEFAIGAVAEDERPMLNESYINAENLDRDKIASTIVKRISEIRKRSILYREKLPALSLIGRTCILVDDGLATGATMVAAVEWLKTKKVKRIIIAVPIASTEGAKMVTPMVDEFVSLVTSSNMIAVGYWYEEFNQVSDNEVLQYLERRHDSKSSLPKAKSIPEEIDKIAVPFKKSEELKSMIEEMSKHRIVMLGEATHGTKEYYQMRREISEILIQDYGYDFIAVEGDWPACYNLNKFAHSDSKKSSEEIVHNSFHRWPTWMWANDEIPPLIDWMKKNDMGGFYGLDVYSLFESLDETKKYLAKINPKLAAELVAGYECFDEFGKNEMKYAESLLKFPEGCEKEVVANLRELLRLRINDVQLSNKEFFDVKQNARVVESAEKYYHTMLSGSVDSWNIRDQHMLETLEHLLHFYGPNSKAIIWAHNTHVGDYHATDMLKDGYINLGGLARERFGFEDVFLCGFGSYKGEVTAAKAWGAEVQNMILPEAKTDSIEEYFHHAAEKSNAEKLYVPLKNLDKDSPLNRVCGHRAVGVVYDPIHERFGSNYVPTKLASRYDAFLFIDETHALKPIPSTFIYGEFPETWPQGQ